MIYITVNARVDTGSIACNLGGDRSGIEGNTGTRHSWWSKEVEAVLIVLCFGRRDSRPYPRLSRYRIKAPPMTTTFRNVDDVGRLQFFRKHSTNPNIPLVLISTEW